MIYKYNNIKGIYLGLLLMLSTSVYTQTINGIATKVSDGDTFVLVCDSEKIKVRLHGIDAPEISQRFGVESKNHLSSLILNRMVCVFAYDTDKYGRLIGRVSNDSITDINKHMIAQGWAWHYSYFYQSKDYANTEKLAKMNKKGLWNDENPINPYQYRKYQHKKMKK